MNNFKLIKSFKSGKFIFYPIKIIPININRIEISLIDNKYLLKLYNNNIITNLEKQIKKIIPKNSILISNFKNNTIVAYKKYIKNRLLTLIKPSHYISNINKNNASIIVTIDNIYCYSNNPNMFFYKLKILEIDYILE